jgi:small-conductance mechanosensitive channel
MLRDIAIFVVLLFAVAVSGFASVKYEVPIYMQLFFSLITLTVIFFVFKIIIGVIAQRAIKDKKTRYSINKVAFIVSFVVFLVILTKIWVEETQVLFISYGIIAAGLAIALQDYFRNFTGGIMITVGGIYRVGDRVEIGGVYGDIMDIGIMTTTLMEIKGWVHADQPTGRISVVPNALVITGPVHNYTRDHSFIWDEITLPVSYDSNWKKTIELVQSIVQRETAEITVRADQEIDRIGEKYYLPKKVTNPAVYVSLTDNWITLDIRYVTETRDRRNVHDKLSRLIIEEIGKEDDIRIASENIIIEGTHRVTIAGKESHE